MKRLLSVTVGLVFCAAPAFAQSTTTTTGEPQVLAQRGSDDSQGSWRGNRSWRDQSADDTDRDDSQSDGRGWRMRRSMQQGQGQGEGQMRRGQSDSDWQERMAEAHAGLGIAGGRQRGVHIRLRRGDTALDLRCPAGASELNACIGAVGQLLDRLGVAAAGTAAHPSTTSPTPSSPASPTEPQAH